MSTVGTRRFTYEDLRDTPQDGKRYELLEGEIYMTPSPNRVHQQAVGNLYLALRRCTDERAAGEVYLAPFDVVLDEHNVVQPDLLFVRKERLLAITPVFVNGAPDLVVEVLSPSNTDFDRTTKRRAYAAAGVPEIWYVDPRDRSVEALLLEAAGSYGAPRRFTGRDILTSPTFPGFELPVPSIFS